VIGKEIGGEHIRGKETLMLIHLLNNTSGEDHEKIKK
jgi:hypothetical protein